MNENLQVVQREIGLGVEDLMQLARNAFEVAWLPRRGRDALNEGLETFHRTALTAAPGSAV